MPYAVTVLHHIPISTFNASLELQLYSTDTATYAWKNVSIKKGDCISFNEVHFNFNGRRMKHHESNEMKPRLFAATSIA